MALALLTAAPFLMPALHAQTVTISPSYISIGVNQTVQYSAAVTVLTNKTVTWSVSGNGKSGTITTGGLYTAPATIPANGVTISALASDKKTSATVYVNIAPAGPPITAVTPNPVPTGNFTVTLTGTGFKSGAIAQIAGANLPTTFVNSTTLKAAGYQGAAGSVVCQVQNPGSLWGPQFLIPFAASGPPPPQTISPTTASVNLGATRQFTSSGATGWSTTAGTVSTAGLYTAPTTMPTSNTATVTATGPGGSASATVTLVNPNAPTISPSAVSLALGGAQQFTSAGATTWTATYGTVTSAGAYTAPLSMSASGKDTVTATGPNGSAAAAVTLIPPTPSITSAGTNGQLPLGIFTIPITGTGFQSNSVAYLNGAPLSTTYSNNALSATGFYGVSGPASLTVGNGASVSAAFPVQVGVPNAVVSAAAARRFLEQSAFGPSPSDAANVQTIGFQSWLNAQYAMPQVSNYNIIVSDQGGMPAHFLTNAVTNPDQLRQRVSFALSQIFVTSIQKLIWNENMVLFQNMLLSDAFGNYRQLMADVTLSPAMGQYLDMANNAKANPAAGSLANENYARELMQLFSIGTNMLNQDGTIQYDANHIPLPTYSQFTITEFARVFTGWTYAPPPGQTVQWDSYISSYGPMAAYPAEHDTGSKQLLNGYIAPAGVTPQQDLDNALDNIFNHPNVGPFVATQMIQHLVKSNPSPAYVSRVAAAFNNNGQGVRGDMKAVITAILLDSEARANDNGGNDQATDGHLQEPALFIAAMVRAFGGQMNDQNYYSSDLATMGQDLFDSPSVFNYYSPGYVVPGTPLIGGEFEIHTPNTAILRANLVSNLFSQYSNPVQDYGPGTVVDITPFLALSNTPATLVSALDLTLTHGVMPSAMKTAIANAVAANPADALHKVEMACYLILSSSYYNVWH
ncbi:MAG TPA: DUF1800 family protein [Candidatus Sulfopaludibacter sp.]|nr:DUF1800 family protein [Candidatus Sulfopaludibacter sp.]